MAANPTWKRMCGNCPPSRVPLLVPEIFLAFKIEGPLVGPTIEPMELFKVDVSRLRAVRRKGRGGVRSRRESLCQVELASQIRDYRLLVLLLLVEYQAFCILTEGLQLSMSGSRAGIRSDCASSNLCFWLRCWINPLLRPLSLQRGEGQRNRAVAVWGDRYCPDQRRSYCARGEGSNLSSARSHRLRSLYLESAASVNVGGASGEPIHTA